MEKNKFEVHYESVLNQYPSLKKPFELNPRGLFFINSLIMKCINDLCEFFNDCELYIADDKPINLKYLSNIEEKLFSLLTFYGLTTNDIYNYLSVILNLYKMGDNTYFNSFQNEHRCRAVAKFLLQREGHNPLICTSKKYLTNDINIPIDERALTIVKVHLYEFIHLLVLSNNPNIALKMRSEYYVESLLAFYKILILINYENI